MRLLRTPLASIAALMLLAACYDVSGPLAPSSAKLRPGAGSHALGVTGVSVILRDSPLAPGLTASSTINGLFGGRLDLPAAGLSIIVPRGAFAGTLTLSVSAVPGKLV